MKGRSLRGRPEAETASRGVLVSVSATCRRPRECGGRELARLDYSLFSRE
jgi:hypothetical protein